MKHCNLIILISAISFISMCSFSQDSYLNDNTARNNNPKVFKSGWNNPDALFLSFGGGYHYNLQENDYGLKGSWVIDISAGIIINRKWIFGANFDYWKINNQIPEVSINKISRNYKGEGVSFFLKYKIHLNKNTSSIVTGLGIGAYRISYTDSEGNYEGSGYLNLSPRIGYNAKIFDFKIGGKKLDFSLNTEIAYYSLFTFARGKKEHRIFNFKLCPAINLFY